MTTTNNNASLLLLPLLLCLALTGVWSADFQCPKKDGQYEDARQCDKYYECKEGHAVEKLCPDGLVFDEQIRKINKCDQPFNIECGDRLELQPPRSKGNCPRRNGFYAHPDPSVCNIFFNCIDGEAIENVCTSGLHFDEYQGICVWPDTAAREGCRAQDKSLKDGFTCPIEHQGDANGQAVAHPKFPHPSDCQKFYVCLSGKTPRELGCTDGQVYNEDIQRCDAPENVPGCEDWFKDSEDAAAAAAAAKSSKPKRP